MIHIGIIGGGNISDTHGRAAREIDGVGIAAIYGANREKSARLAKAFGASAYDDLGAFLEHQPMQIVLIGSPSGLHAEQGIAAARRGLHVLVEKPIDRILEDFLRAIETDTQPLCDGREGRRSVELVQAIYESSRTGRPVILASSATGV